MQFNQEFSVPFARSLVWAAFHDLETIAKCMPGAQLTAPPQNGHLVGQVSIKLGPIAASFAGEGDVRFDERAFTGEIAGGGTDRKSSSRAKGTAKFALMEAEAGRSTLVRVAVDYQLAGALAQFSRANIVQDLAARLTQNFAGNLQVHLAAAAEAGQAAAPVAPTASFDLGAVLWTMLRGWLRRLFVRV